MEARAELGDLTADLPVLNERAAEFARGADEARRSRDLNAAADLERQQQVFSNLARDQRGDIAALAGEIEKLEAALKREGIRQQLISAAKTATEAHEQVDLQIAEFGAAILPRLRELVSTLDRLRGAQHSFDRGCSALGMPRRAFNITTEAHQQFEEFVLELEQTERVTCDAALAPRPPDSVTRLGTRYGASFAETPFSDDVFRLLQRLVDHPADFGVQG